MGLKKIMWPLTVFMLTAVTFLLILRTTSWAELSAAFQEVRLPFVVAGLGIMALYVVGEGVSLKLSLHTLGEKVTFRSCVRCAFIGHYFSSVTPSSSGGQPAQVYWLAKAGQNGSKSTLALLLISAVYQLAMLLYGLAAFLVLGRLVQAPAASIKWLLIFGGVTNTVLIAVILLMMFSQKSARWLLSRLLDLPLTVRLISAEKKAELKIKLDQALADYQQGAAHLRHNLPLLLQLLLISFLRLTLLYSIPYLTYLSFGLSGHSLLEFLGLQALFMIAVSSLPLPGSAGASEGTFLLLYSLLFGSRLLKPAMVLSRGISFYSFLLISGLVVAFSAARPGKWARKAAAQ